MKKICSVIVSLLILANCAVPAFAATNPIAQNIGVEITSPTSIEGKPVYNADIEITVKNMTDHEISNLICYLMIVDLGRDMTYPVDEFGTEAYQTRSITSLPAHGECIVVIPVKILYVGHFQFSASVTDLENNHTVTADPLSVNMIAVSELNKPLVVSVAVVIPLLIAGYVILHTNHRKGSKKHN
ncbi:hypothetical protein [Lachnoclostridium phytofermentans]|uniref:CARDB domain-containing protein n=1 Tax=Lachnoclostridium phytofermentans (strain ATCC 700394 / DSM 18823 / ISDg) TaxID=357809 RepID=A9KPU5_LACP7|nr:hypothetical protein [Lachnoclostridium phytofermentans]ABX41844.1 hypothetical protein Cphy_1470 [Lachnoclostridium phytofermentans ISDg]